MSKASLRHLWSWNTNFKFHNRHLIFIKKIYIASDILFACLCLYKHTPLVIHIYFRPESDDESLDLSPSSSLDIHKSHFFHFSFLSELSQPQSIIQTYKSCYYPSLIYFYTFAFNQNNSGKLRSIAVLSDLKFPQCIQH